MQFVDLLVQRSPVQGSVRPVVKEVFKDEEEEYLRGDRGPLREGNLVRGHAKVFSQGMEGPDLRELNGKMSEKDVFCALPLLCSSRNLLFLQLPLSKVWISVDKDPWYASSKVENLVYQERHDACSQHRIVYPPVAVASAPMRMSELRKLNSHVPSGPPLFWQAQRVPIVSSIQMMRYVSCLECAIDAACALQIV